MGDNGRRVEFRKKRSSVFEKYSDIVALIRNCRPVEKCPLVAADRIRLECRIGGGVSEAMLI